MAKRKALEEIGGGNYFASTDKAGIKFISSGCELFDCVLGGGYPIGRIVNIVGDKSTGKTLLAIEACVNFAKKYPQGPIWYTEAEAAFDPEYAEALGLPLDRISFTENCSTVEDWFEHLMDILKKIPDDQEALYIIDSLDALSDRAELDREIDKGSMGAAKAKKLSELFRRLVKKIQHKQLTIIVVSQIRDKIGVMFGKKTTRSGGHALDFYASQVVYLAQIKRLKKTRKKVERATGVMIRASCDKNKIGLPYRSCDFPILFGYGIDDLSANLDWLEMVGQLELVGLTKATKAAFIKNYFEKDLTPEVRKSVKRISKKVRRHWENIEVTFLPKRSKY